MGWPDPRSFAVASPRRRRPKYGGEAHEAIRQQVRSAGIAREQDAARQPDRSEVRRKEAREQVDAAVAEALDFIQSEEFERWFEHLTDAPVARWRKRCLRAVADWEHHPAFSRPSPLLVLRRELRLLAETHRRVRVNRRAGWTRELLERGARSKRRRLLQNLATPPWVDHSAIAEIYRQCRARTVETGVVHHVDHIVPILGRHVCGLHVEWNLRVITAAENLRKSNRFDHGDATAIREI